MNTTPCVLVVDDIEAARYAKARTLQKAGYRVVEADTGAKALEVAEALLPEAVLLDVNLPDINGFEVAKRLRANPHTAGIAIVQISASFVQNEDTVRGLEDGADVYLTIPVEPAVLLATVRAMVRLRASEQELRHHREHLESLVQQRTAELEASHLRMRISERMASLGTLAAGLGHDMGNVLLPLRIRLETLEAMNLPPEAAAEIEGIRASTDYLRKLAGGLRLLAIDSKSQPAQEVTALDAWWAETEALYRNILPRNVALEHALQDAEVQIAIPRAALTQIVFNLVQNAGDVMRALGSGFVRVSSAREAGVVRLSVSDTGPGMTDEVRARCMEPFFTTKPRGLSTGLGLALVYSLTKDAGGTIDLESKVGVGTTFHLRFPLAESASAEALPARRAFVDVRDPRMRAFVTAELRVLNFEVAPPDTEPQPGDTVVTDDPNSPARSAGTIVIEPKQNISEVRAALRRSLTGAQADTA